MFCTEVRPIGTESPVRKTVIGQQCNSVVTAKPGDRTTDSGIVMHECYESSQRVDSLSRVVITPVRHTHTQLHGDLICVACVCNKCKYELYFFFFCRIIYGLKLCIMLIYSTVYVIAIKCLTIELSNVYTLLCNQQ